MNKLKNGDTEEEFAKRALTKMLNLVPSAKATPACPPQEAKRAPMRPRSEWRSKVTRFDPEILPIIYESKDPIRVYVAGRFFMEEHGSSASPWRWIVLRFTGSEVYRDALKCAREALSIAMKVT